MTRCWLSGTRPWKTVVSVPRLMPLARVSTTTSPGPGSDKDSQRSSPRPGATTQNASASTIEAALEQDVATEVELAHRRTQAVAEAPDLRERDARTARAHDQRRDRDLQAMEAAGGEEPRDRDPAACDEHPAQPARRQEIEHGHRREGPVLGGDADHLRLPEAPVAFAELLATQDQ